MNDGDGELLKIEIKRKGAEDDGKKKNETLASRKHGSQWSW